MKWAKEDSKYEKDLLEVEELLDKKGISIVWQYGLIVSFPDGREFRIEDIEDSRELGLSFPRQVESEKLVLIEN